MGIVVGIILFIGMITTMNGIFRLSTEVKQLGWRHSQTIGSIRVALMGVAIIALGLFGVWINGHVR